MLWFRRFYTMPNDKSPFHCDQFQWFTGKLETDTEGHTNKASRSNITLRNLL